MSSTWVQLTSPDWPYRADILCVKGDGHIWHFATDGGAGGITGSGGQGYVDRGTAGAGFVAVSPRWDDHQRLCLHALDRDGTAFQAVLRVSDGGWDEEWHPIASGVLT